MLTGILVLVTVCYFLFVASFPLQQLGLTALTQPQFLLVSLGYILILGFIISAICGYFSGLVGVTATPGSAVIIAGLLIVALIIRLLLNTQVGIVTSAQWLAAAAITILIGSVIEGAAAIANDNTQDLKVGHILGATPWKQQLMLMLGVLVSSLVIPLIMELMFQVYGIADVLPREGMDPTQSLPAPPAALMAAVTQGVFKHSLPWDMVFVGALVAIVTIVINIIVKRKWQWELSVLGVAIGIYLPLQSSMPLFFGGILAWLTAKGLKKKALGDNYIEKGKQSGMLLACGLVAGAALMDVILAIPFAIMQSPDIFRLLPTSWLPLSEVLGVVVTILLGLWFYRRILETAAS